MTGIYGQNDNIIINADSWGIVSFDKNGKPYIVKSGFFVYLDFNAFIDYGIKFADSGRRTPLEIHFPKQVKTYVPTNDLPKIVEIVSPEIEPVVKATPSLNICVQGEKESDTVYYEYTYKKDESNRPIYKRVEDTPKGVDEQPCNMEPSRSAREIYLDSLKKT